MFNSHSERGCHASVEGACEAMRVVGGRARGMRLACPPVRDVRPTPVMAREALFNILRDTVEGATVLDLFAGTGTVGIEALSRGAAWCVFVERAPKTRQVLERNLARTRLAEFCDVLQRDAFHCIEAVRKLGREFDVVYLGPPFPLWHNDERKAALIDLLDDVAGAGLLKKDGLLIAQHEPRTKMPDTTVQLRRFDQRKYGRNMFTFYEKRIRTEN